MKITTTIKVNGEHWNVPRGFGATYQSIARRHNEWLAAGRPGEVIHSIIAALGAIGFAPTLQAVVEWPMFKRVEAIAYAATVHARAGDNPVRRHPVPKWLHGVRPWGGPWRGQGAFAGPSPTEITS